MALAVSCGLGPAKGLEPPVPGRGGLEPAVSARRPGPSGTESVERNAGRHSPRVPYTADKRRLTPRVCPVFSAYSIPFPRSAAWPVCFRSATGIGHTVLFQPYRPARRRMASAFRRGDPRQTRTGLPHARVHVVHRQSATGVWGRREGTGIRICRSNTRIAGSAFVLALTSLDYTEAS